jgi:purine-nucleoside phosphorylase
MAVIYAMSAAAAVSAAASVYSGYQQSQANKYNAEVAQQNAEQARLDGMAAADQQRRDNQRKFGASQAAYGASGVDMEGSPLSVMDDQFNEGTLSVLMQQHNAETKQNYYRNQSTGSQFAASQALAGGFVQGGAALIGGGAKAYGYGESANAGKATVIA